MAKLVTFNKYANLLTDEMQKKSDAAAALRRELYVSMYEELTKEVEGKKNQTEFIKLMDSVLQQTLKLEWRDFLEEQRIANMTEEEKAAEIALQKQQERSKVYNALVKEGKVDDAIAILEEDLVEEISQLTENKIQQQKYVIKTYSDELNEARANPDTSFLFDKLEFADRVIDELVELEADTTIEIRRNAKRNVYLKAFLRDWPDEIIEEELKSVTALGTPASKKVRTVLLGFEMSCVKELHFTIIINLDVLASHLAVRAVVAK
jgi:hypothetical protein